MPEETKVLGQRMRPAALNAATRGRWMKVGEWVIPAFSCFYYYF